MQGMEAQGNKKVFSLLILTKNMTHWRGGNAVKKVKRGSIQIEHDGRVFTSYSQLYFYLPFPKIQFWTFKKRLLSGMSVKDSISTNWRDPEKKYYTIKKIKKPAYIDIRLTKEEAMVFDREYRSEICKLENILADEDSFDNEIQKRLNSLKEEYDVFRWCNLGRI